MWIILTTKLPTQFSPPKMSIHWAIPWSNKKFAEKQFKMTGRKKRARNFIYPILDYSNGTKAYFNNLYGGKEPHWAGARKIHYKDENIRIFPHEFSILSAKNMKDYLDESHIFVADTAAERHIQYDITNGDLRRVHDAALLDGCNKEQAVLMALGIDVSDDSVYPQPIGWYQIKPEYGLAFCTKEKLLEHNAR